MSVYLAPIVPTSDKAAETSIGTYATIRNETGPTATPGATTRLGQRGVAGPYACAQYFLTIDTRAIPVGTNATLTLSATAANAANADTLEVREVSSAANLIAGDSLASFPLL